MLCAPRLVAGFTEVPQGDLCPPLHPSGASKVTASGSRRSRLTARTEAGVPGPSLARVLGHVEVECDPEAGAVTILRECGGPS